MALTTTIATFVTDTKDRIATITQEMQALTKRNAKWHRLYDLRENLINFMELIQPIQGPSSGDNFLNASGWTDQEMENEIYFWRGVSGIDTDNSYTLQYKTY